jgi:FtsP/CotA-like multicopper oxidase with cupredoxin domain
VHNSLTTEGTSIHWHGFLQTGTPWYDGTTTVSQCPIAPGVSFTYRFRAELYGTTWWHGHYSAQYIEGLVGPIVIHGPKSSDYDIDIGPVLLSDWFYDDYQSLLERIYHSSEKGPILPPMSQNMLINGKANYDCKNTNRTCTPNAGLASFKFTTGKKHLIRFINTAAEALIFASIDGYNMTVVANDFVPVEPYVTDLITLAVGQRTEVIVQGRDDPSESVWLRMTEGPSGLGPAGSTGCSLNDGNAYTTTAGIYYQNADTSIAPTTESAINGSRYLFPNACGNQDLALTVPEFKMNVTDPEVTINLLATGQPNATGEFVWFMNNVTYLGDLNDPIFLDAAVGKTNFTSERQVFNLGNAKSVRIVMTSVGFPASHPMHIHGHNFYVLDEGVGSWNGTIVNKANPQRRDVQLIRPNGYLVVQLDLANAGVWPFHCHVAWHASEGMNINLLEQTPTVQKMQVPATVADGCRSWWNWTNQ